MPKLTKATVTALPPRDKQYTVWDEELSGFGVFVHPKGTKTYFIDYRVGGNRRRMSIGRHGVLTADEARKRAIAQLGDVARGQDPQLERKTRRRSITVAELCEDYLAAARAGLVLSRRRVPKKGSTLDTDEGRIRRHIIPLLGKKGVLTVTRADVQQFIWDVTVGKTALVEKSERQKKRGKAVVTGGAGTAARTAGLLGGIFTYAQLKGIRDDNPVHGVPRAADKRRQRRLRPDEYKKLGDVLREADDQLPQAREGIWLIALTGARISEIQTLTRSAIQSDGRTVILDDSKTGRSVRPFAKVALDVIDRLPAVPNNDYVLTAARAETGHYGGLDGAVTRLMARAGLEGVTAHTLRHSFASIGNDLGYSDATIGAVIGHGTHSMTAHYIHHLDSGLISAADAIAGEVLHQMRTGKASERR